MTIAMNCIVIGTNVAAKMKTGFSCVIVGDSINSDETDFPDNYCHIEGVFEGVVDQPDWAEQVGFAQREALLHGWPAAISSLMQGLDCNPGEAADVTRDTLIATFRDQDIAARSAAN